MDSPRVSKVNCCVVGCHNAYYNTNGSIKFYSFPAKWYEVDRRNAWIKSVKRVNEYGDLWSPKIHDRICSTHFVGNERSNHPHSPAYNPTIFPKEYLKQNSNVQQKDERFGRALNRTLLKEKCVAEIGDNIAQREIVVGEVLTPETPSDPIIEKACFGCQVNLDSHDNSEFIFECHFSMTSLDVAVQTNIHADNKLLFKSQSDKCVGSDESVKCKGFHGYNSITKDNELSALAGVFIDRFLLLLSFLSSIHGNCKLDKENQLLLFLMKMKLGLSYTALGVLFQVHETTCSRIFTVVLQQLVEKTRNFVFWPSRESVDFTMPTVFKEHYPRCRAIIDCTEIKIQRPSRVDQRIYCYSQYKSNFTAKFLIAISPTGFVSFVSSCYGGRSSDTYITNDSGLLHLLEENDVLLADKGFPGIKCKDNVVLVIPPFVHEGHLTTEEVEETYTIASVRIHVERSIQRVKVYNILRNVPYNLFPLIDDIVQMCCVLTNLQPPIIQEDGEDQT